MSNSGADRLAYGQCWEDADILLQALGDLHGKRCLSIGSGGENSLALLAAGAQQVTVIDSNPAQIFCLQLKLAAFQCLVYEQVLEFLGWQPCSNRLELYHQCRQAMTANAREFWDKHPQWIVQGLVNAGKFEHYLAKFRRFILPLCHTKQRIDHWFAQQTASERRDYYHRVWNTWRWRLLFRLFCSQAVMSRLGRQRSYFRYVEASVAEHLLRRVEQVLITHSPDNNPYLCRLLTGENNHVMPVAMRPENFDTIRQNLGKLTWHVCTLDEYLGQLKTSTSEARFEVFNLSNIFEYMSEADFHTSLSKLADIASSGSLMVYWNMMVNRTSSVQHGDQFCWLSEVAAELHGRDQIFFYSNFVVAQRL